MNNPQFPLFLSTAIPYVNAAPHVGHALELLQADALCRHQRQRGRDVRLTGGTDDHSLKNARAAERLGTKPLAKIVAYATSGVAPKDIFIAPVSAVRQVLGKAACRLSDIDLFELNEAFAAQMLACGNELKLDEARVNVHGGAIALGHPIGASGARVLVTLLSALEQRGAKRGLASLCLGGGNAVAMVVERV